MDDARVPRRLEVDPGQLREDVDSARRHARSAGRYRRRQSPGVAPRGPPAPEPPQRLPHPLGVDRVREDPDVEIPVARGTPWIAKAWAPTTRKRAPLVRRAASMFWKSSFTRVARTSDDRRCEAGPESWSAGRQGSVDRERPGFDRQGPDHQEPILGGGGPVEVTRRLGPEGHETHRPRSTGRLPGHRPRSLAFRHGGIIVPGGLLRAPIPRFARRYNGAAF